MKHPATQALHAYWNAQRRGRCAPNRHELDPSEMRGVLPHTFMLEAGEATGSFPIRISGTRLDALLGRSLKGEAFADLWPAAGRNELQAILAGVLDEARPALVGVRGAPEGQAPMSFELLVLPLRHHGRTHARLLCGLVPATTPSWLGLWPVAQLSVSSWRYVDPAVEVATERSRAGGLRREHLLVYEGGRAHEAASASTPQSRVKAHVPRSPDMLLSTRRS